MNRSSLALKPYLSPPTAPVVEEWVYGFSNLISQELYGAKTPWICSAILHGLILCVGLIGVAFYQPPALLTAHAVPVPVVFVGPQNHSDSAAIMQPENTAPVQSSPVDVPITAKKLIKKVLAAENGIAPKPITEYAPSQINPDPNPVDSDVKQKMVSTAAVSADSFQGLPLLRSPDYANTPSPPIYPPKSVANGEEGKVIVRAMIDADGVPQDILIWQSSGFSLLDRAVRQAVQQWRFVPAKRALQPISAWVEVPVNFVLN